MQRISDENLRIQVFGALLKYSTTQVFTDLELVKRYGYHDEVDAFSSPNRAEQLSKLFDSNYELICQSVSYITGKPFNFERDGKQEIQEVRDYINNYVLSDRQIEQFKHLIIGGWNIGDQCVWPHYDENEHGSGYFDVKSLEGIELFYNLEAINLMGWHSDDLDLTPLLNNRSVNAVIASDSVEKNNTLLFAKVYPKISESL